MLGVAKINKQQLFTLKTNISANTFQKQSIFYSDNMASETC